MDEFANLKKRLCQKQVTNRRGEFSLMGFALLQKGKDTRMYQCAKCNEKYVQLWRELSVIWDKSPICICYECMKKIFGEIELTPTISSISDHIINELIYNNVIFMPAIPIVWENPDKEYWGLYELDGKVKQDWDKLPREIKFLSDEDLLDWVEEKKLPPKIEFLSKEDILDWVEENPEVAPKGENDVQM